MDILSHFIKEETETREVKLELANGRVRINAPNCVTSKPKTIHSAVLPCHFLCQVSSKREENGIFGASNPFPKKDLVV